MGVSQRRHVDRARELFGNALVVGRSERDTRALVHQAYPIVDPGGARVRVWPPPDRPDHASPDAVLSAVEATQHDLVMKALAHKPGARGAGLDPLDMRLIRQCPCPVWLADPAHATRVRRVLAAISPILDDRADQAVTVLSTAAAIAATAGAELHVLHAWIAFGESLLRPRVPPEEHRAYIESERASAVNRVERSLAEVRLRLAPSRVHIVKGHFQYVLPDVLERERIDLVVMGTRGRRGWIASALVRPFPEVVLRETCSPLLVVKSGVSRGQP